MNYIHPMNFTIKFAYEKIRTWYQENISEIESRNTSSSLMSVELIKRLPDPDNVTLIEIKGIFGEIIYGNLEWGYAKKDENCTMADYAKALFRTGNDTMSYEFSEEELSDLKTNSSLWEYMTLSKRQTE